MIKDVPSFSFSLPSFVARFEGGRGGGQEGKSKE